MEERSEYTVKTKKERIIIPKHMSVKVECHVQMQTPHEDTTLIFEPDVNPGGQRDLKSVTLSSKSVKTPGPLSWWVYKIPHPTT